MESKTYDDNELKESAKVDHPIQSDTNAEVLERAMNYVSKTVGQKVHDRRRNASSEALMPLLCARVMRGSTQKHFETLHKDGIRVRPFSWIMGCDGIEMFLRKDTLTAMRGLGFEDDWIKEKLKCGDRFRLVIFPKTDVYCTTWDGIFDLVKIQYPAVYKKLERHEKMLKTLSFAEIEEIAKNGFLKGDTYLAVNETSDAGVSNDSRYITTDILVSDDCEATLEEVRGWLYFVLGLSGYFDGSGWTKDRNGERIVREYIIRNRNIRDFCQSKYIDLELDLTNFVNE